MRLAIHKSNTGFSIDWIAYCEQQQISYKIVNCYHTDIITHLEDCDALLWHFHHTSAKDFLFAKQLLYSLQHIGKKVFPNFATAWHFDDKVGQKYLLEALDAPLVKTFVFYDKESAFEWLKNSDFPKVFKLRGGAGSTNVKLIHNKGEAKKLINQAFSKGFPSYNGWVDLSEKWMRYRMGKGNLNEILKSIRRLLMSTQFAKIKGPERGYIYIQNFVPGNTSDIRIVTVGERAFGIKRLVRKNDFRASGSGVILYDKAEIDLRCVKLAFETSEKLQSQVVAYDFVFDNNVPKIVEINFGYAHKSYFDCPGYWDKNLNWHEGMFNSAHWIIEDIIKN